MKIKSLGRSGLKVSEVCLGTMTFGAQADENTSFAIMDTADRLGVTFFDTADAYPPAGELPDKGRTEEIVGKWLHERGARERIVLATKCRGQMGPHPNDEGLSRKHVIRACDDSLRRLRTDYVDLYQAHHPDPTTPIEETLRAFEDLVRAGKVRYVGVSNFPAHQLSDAIWTARTNGLSPIVSDQPRYSLLFRMIEDEIVPVCQTHGLGIMAYNPLAGGVLTGRYRHLKPDQPTAEGRFKSGTRQGETYRQRYFNEAIFEAVDTLARFLEPRGLSMTHAALAWVLARPFITSAIVGASRPEQLEDSLQAVGLKLDADVERACDDVWFSLPRERDPQVARR
ncbi:MAG TPA: aldo/keto reductase [Chloroflexota bacterium]|nr:aldo/keto reductase [Chloroflexota bacterium]